MLKRLLPLALIIGILLAGMAEAEQPAVYRYHQTSAFALFPGIDPLVVEVVIDKAQANQIECVAVSLRPDDPEQGVMINGRLCLKLNDNGKNGDKAAADGIYSGTAICNFPAETRRGYLYYGGDVFIVYKGAKYDSVQGYSGDKTLQCGDGVSFLIVNPKFKGKSEFALYQLVDNIYATDYAVFIVDAEQKLFPGFPLVKVTCGDREPLIGAAKELYAVYPDKFDFITVMPGGTMWDPRRPWDLGGYGENVPYFISVRQQIQGIGLTTWDNTAAYGSAGRLQGAIYHSFGDASVLLHEVGHQWGIHYGYQLGLSNDSNHWAENIAFSDYDEMAEYFRANDGYSYNFRYHEGQLEQKLNTGEKSGFSDLTLYLMGLLPAAEVQPIRLLSKIKIVDGKVTAAEQVITIEELIAAEGTRKPSFEEAQKDFSMAFVIITQDVPTPAEAAAISLMAKYFGSDGPREGDIVPFNTATGGRGTMTTKLPKVKGTLVTTGAWADQEPEDPTDKEPEDPTDKEPEDPTDTEPEDPTDNEPEDPGSSASAAFPWLPVGAGAGGLCLLTGGIIYLLKKKKSKSGAA